jgi:hypothetical protein
MDKHQCSALTLKGMRCKIKRKTSTYLLWCGDYIFHYVEPYNPYRCSKHKYPDIFINNKLLLNAEYKKMMQCEVLLDITVLPYDCLSLIMEYL